MRWQTKPNERPTTTSFVVISVRAPLLFLFGQFSNFYFCLLRQHCPFVFMIMDLFSLLLFTSYSTPPRSLQLDIYSLVQLLWSFFVCSGREIFIVFSYYCLLLFLLLVHSIKFADFIIVFLLACNIWFARDYEGFTKLKAFSKMAYFKRIQAGRRIYSRTCLCTYFINMTL